MLALSMAEHDMRPMGSDLKSKFAGAGQGPTVGYVTTTAFSLLLPLANSAIARGGSL